MDRRALICLVLLCACHRTESTPSAVGVVADAAIGPAAAIDPADPTGLSSLPDSQAEIAPTLTVTPSGVTVIAWSARRSGKPDVIRVRFSRDNGATWEPLQTLSAPDDRLSGDPVVTSDAKGNAWLVWLGWRPEDGGTSDTHVYVARADASGTRFADPIEVTGIVRQGTTISRPWIAINGSGKALVTWAFRSLNGDGVGIAESTDGERWTRGVVIERIDLHARAPFVCASTHGNRAWVAYLDSESGVRVRASDDGGTTWSPARVATVSAHDDRALVAEQPPICVGDNEDVIVAYARGRKPTDAGPSIGASSIVVAHSVDGGRSFDARKVFDAGAGNVLYPQMLREPDGSLDLAFYGSGATRETGALRWTRAADEKSPFSAAKSLREHFQFEPSEAEPAWPGSYFGWAWHDGSLFAASVDNAGEQPHIAFTHVASR